MENVTIFVLPTKQMKKKKWTPQQIENWNKTKGKGIRTYQEKLKIKAKVKKHPTPPKKQVAIKRRTKKRAADERIYNARVAELKLDENNVCAANWEGCTGCFDHNHHGRGRTGDLLLNEEFWVFLCESCHRIVELMPNKAKKEKLSFLRIDRIGYRIGKIK